MRKHLILSLVLLFTVNALISQSYDIMGVRRVNASGMSAITENNEVKGYYSIVAFDKAGKKKRNYNLSILDNSLKKLYSIDFAKATTAMPLESSYNGDRFCFSYYDLKKKVLEFNLYDKAGLAAGTYSLKVSKTEAALYQQSLKTEEDVLKGNLVAVKGKGFIRYGYVPDKKYRVQVELIDNAGKVKWSLDSKTTEKKAFESVVPLFTDEKVAISLLVTRPKLMVVKGTFYQVLFVNTETGQEYFRLGKSTREEHLVPSGATYDAYSKHYFVYGQFWPKGADLIRDDSKGFYMQEVDLTGKIITESLTRWEDQINAAIFKKTKGELPKNMKMYIHSVIRTADGKVFTIAEQYRKAVSAAGVALNVLAAAQGGASSASAIEMQICDMVILEFDNKLGFKDASIIDKQKSKLLLPQGWGKMDANILGAMMKTYGWFDYAFTTTSSDKKTFTSCYVDFERDKEAGSNYTVGVMSYTKDGKFAFDKIKLTTKPTIFYVYEAKPGYVAIFEYYRKEKKASMRLEKINY